MRPWGHPVHCRVVSDILADITALLADPEYADFAPLIPVFFEVGPILALQDQLAR